MRVGFKLINSKACVLDLALMATVRQVSWKCKWIPRIPVSQEFGLDSVVKDGVWASPAIFFDVADQKKTPCTEQMTLFPQQPHACFLSWHLTRPEPVQIVSFGEIKGQIML